MAKNDIFSFDKPEQSPGFLLWQVTNLWQRKINAILRPYGLTHAQFVVLATLAWFKKQKTNPTQIQISSFSKMDAMFVSAIIQYLENKKWVKREVSAADSRAKNVTLTTEGFRLVAKMIKKVEEFDRDFFSKLGKSQNSLNRILQELIEIKIKNS